VTHTNRVGFLLAKIHLLKKQHHLYLGYMITQELVLFIKQQLQEGKSKEQIANILTPHGWQLEDINQVFTQIMPTAQPVMPTAQPVMVQPMMQTQSQPAMSAQPAMQPVISAQTQMMNTNPGFLDRFKNPSVLFAFITIIFSVVASTLAFYNIQMSQLHLLPVGSSQNAIIGALLGGLIIATLFGGLVVKIVTKILNIEPRSFAKAFVFTSITLLVSSLLGFLALAGLSKAIIVIPSLIIWALIFNYYYNAGIWKTVGAFFLNWVVTLVIGVAAVFGVMALGIGAGFTALFMHPKTVAPIMINPAVQLQVNIPSSPQNTIPPGLVPTSASSSTSVSTTAVAATITNPDLPHVEGAFPVNFPLPADADVLNASVASATDLEGIRYILDYTSTHSAAYLRNAMKVALESDGYMFSANETNPDYRIITGSKVVRNTSKTVVITIQKAVTGTITVHAVLTQ
jgi:hypothetical protein